MAQRLVAHLTDEGQFWPRYPVPTVALNDPKFEPRTMWRGPTWVNVNYLLVEGLERSGFPQQAAELRRRTLDMMLGDRDIFEFYECQTGECPPRAASTFGWSSALFIELALQASRS
jgi:glycogen debranching enzyme